MRWDVQRDMMQIMMTAVAELCHIFGPEMAARGFGRIVNISSVAAFVPGQAGGALYPSVKAFVLRLSQSLATEYQTAGVHVVAVCPGFTWSEFHDVVGNRAQMNKLPGFMWLDGPKVVSDAHNAVEAGRGPVVVNGWVYKVLATLLQIIPDNWVGRLAARGTRNSALRPEDARDKPVSPTPKGPTKKPAKKSNGKSSRTAKTPARKPAKRTGKQADNG